MINPKLKEIFQQFNIDYTEGVLYLTAVFYQLPINENLVKALDTTIKQVNISKVIDRDYKNHTIIWNEPLFNTQETQWGWVEEYRKLFRSVRPDRAGTSISCTKRMKEYFKDNPSVRKDDVMEATRLYLKELTNPDYLQGADYFIKKGVGAAVTSKLTEYVERILLRKEVADMQTSKRMGT
jgi:hypothetical protein